MNAVKGQYHIALYYIEEVAPEDIYYYNDKPYCVMEETKMKIEGVWVDCVIYQCLYENPDGMIWVRPKGLFYELFKKKDG